MEPATTQIIVAILGAVGAGAGGWIGSQAAIKATLAVLEQRVERAEDDILSLRKSRHDIADRVASLQLDILRSTKTPLS